LGGPPLSELPVTLERPRAGVAVLTLNRPERLNAISVDMLDRLFVALDDIEADDSCRVVVMTGAGRGFCAGIDLREAAELMATEAAAARGAGFARVAPRLRALPQPVVAAVNGPAVGAGFVLTLASDVRIAARSATFADGFVRVGLSACEMGISWLLARLIGASRAAEILLTGRTIDADEAERAGLVHRVVADGSALEFALELAEGMLAASPAGLRATKRAMWATLETPDLEGAIELETRAQAETVAAMRGGEDR
jgi:enoyl-CoA hydratase/carnithine racemase